VVGGGWRGWFCRYLMRWKPCWLEEEDNDASLF
jgi:hypothetical protein